MDKLTKGCIVMMKSSSRMEGYGNPQCISSVCEPLDTISLYGHNQHYKIWDIEKVLEYPVNNKLVEALKDFLNLTIKNHSQSKLFREQLESGELKKRLEIIGKDFDPSGRVKLCITTKQILKDIGE
jgi:hypothetical protein